ncbi:MAG: NHL repeat-containing protein, partial [bacterium]
ILLLLALSVWWRWFPMAREAGYRFAGSWTLPTSKSGAEPEPIGIAIAGKEVFVSDAGSHRIVVFDREGNYIREFASEGDGPGELGRPMLMDVDPTGKKLYVAEYLNDRIQVFTLTGEPLETIGSSGSGPGEFDSPSGVQVDDAGRIYVADFFNHRVQVLTPEGNFIKQYGITGRKGIRKNLFNYPTDVALLADGSLVIADAYNDRIQVFRPDGSFLRKWGGPFATNIHGPFNGWFKTATAVAVGPDENIFVADFYNNRIQKFSSEGNFLVTIGSNKSKPAGLRFPTDVAIDSKGTVYIADFGNRRIARFVPIEDNIQ